MEMFDTINVMFLRNLKFEHYGIYGILISVIAGQ